jgi:Uncharacterized protein conserved in bacteria
MSIFEKKNNAPEVYSQKEEDAVAAHINEYFGEPDAILKSHPNMKIDANIYIIFPREEHNYYTLVTQGAGAHKMNMPKEFTKYGCERAEFLINLPPDWDIQSRDNKWFWPFDCLRTYAEMPIHEDSWVGSGHTVANGSAFAENTDLSAMLFTHPYPFGKESSICTLPNGDGVEFYQLIPIYESEMNYKLMRNAGMLQLMIINNYGMTVDINRPKVVPDKTWHVNPQKLQQLVDWDGPDGCFVTDRILVDGCKVGYMERKEPTKENAEQNSGWSFFSDDEDDEYWADKNNYGIYSLNSVANVDPDIIPLLNSPYGSAFYRDEDGKFYPDNEENES